MRNGTPLPAGRISLDDARANAGREIARLPPHVRAIDPTRAPYRVEISESLEAIRRRPAAST